MPNRTKRVRKPIRSVSLCACLWFYILLVKVIPYQTASPQIFLHVQFLIWFIWMYSNLGVIIVFAGRVHYVC